jgi:hypothetical protein
MVLKRKEVVMGTKMGRPLSGDKPLTHDIKVRVDDETHLQLKEYSERKKMTVAESVRCAISKLLSEENK